MIDFAKILLGLFGILVVCFVGFGLAAELLSMADTMANFGGLLILCVPVAVLVWAARYIWKKGNI